MFLLALRRPSCFDKLSMRVISSPHPELVEG